MGGCTCVTYQQGCHFIIVYVCLPSYAAQRMYIFAAETEHDLKEWKAAMDNCMAKFISGGTISADSHTRLVRIGTPW